MFREIRRKEKKLTIEECHEILTKAEYGTLATMGADGYPYAGFDTGPKAPQAVVDTFNLYGFKKTARSRGKPKSGRLGPDLYYEKNGARG